MVVPDQTPTPDNSPAEVTVNEETVTTDVVLELESYWVAALSALGVPAAGAEEQFAGIVAAHSGEERAYHNLNHLNNMRLFLEGYADQLERPAEVALVVLYHDYVYDSTTKDNEEQSAAVAREQLTALGVAKESVDFISDLIISTKKHTPERPGSDNEFLLDADLSILGTEPEAYIEYSDAIREEYSWVPEDDYKAGRAAVLESFLEREAIFIRPEVRESLETQARHNLKFEKLLLSK
jgi:predicted metal-dependent HD superfamily phosphohydrolase